MKLLLDFHKIGTTKGMIKVLHIKINILIKIMITLDFLLYKLLYVGIGNFEIRESFSSFTFFLKYLPNCLQISMHNNMLENVVKCTLESLDIGHTA